MSFIKEFTSIDWDKFAAADIKGTEITMIMGASVNLYPKLLEDKRLKDFWLPAAGKLIKETGEVSTSKLHYILERVPASQQIIEYIFQKEFDGTLGYAIKQFNWKRFDIAVTYVCTHPPTKERISMLMTCVKYNTFTISHNECLLLAQYVPVYKSWFTPDDVHVINTAIARAEASRTFACGTSTSIGVTPIKITSLGDGAAPTPGLDFSKGQWTNISATALGYPAMSIGLTYATTVTENSVGTTVGGPVKASVVTTLSDSSPHTSVVHSLRVHDRVIQELAIKSERDTKKIEDLTKQIAQLQEVLDKITKAL